MHELAHTLGLSHADQSTDELMTPLHSPGTGPDLGPGDTTGLQLVGCTLTSTSTPDEEPPVAQEP